MKIDATFAIDILEQAGFKVLSTETVNDKAECQAFEDITNSIEPGYYIIETPSLVEIYYWVGSETSKKSSILWTEYQMLVKILHLFTNYTNIETRHMFEIVNELPYFNRIEIQKPRNVLNRQIIIY